MQVNFHKVRNEKLLIGSGKKPVEGDCDEFTCSHKDINLNLIRMDLYTGINQKSQLNLGKEYPVKEEEKLDLPGDYGYIYDFWQYCDGVIYVFDEKSGATGRKKSGEQLREEGAAVKQMLRSFGVPVRYWGMADMDEIGRQLENDTLGENINTITDPHKVPPPVVWFHLEHEDDDDGRRDHARSLKNLLDGIMHGFNSQ